MNSLRAEEWIQTIEETENRKLSPASIRMIKWVDKVAQAAKIMGQRDAADGNEAYTEADFMEWGSEQYPDDSKTAALIAELAYLHYADGYKSERVPV